MKKVSWLVLSIWLVSLFLLILKFSSPFGFWFDLGSYGFAICSAMLLLKVGIWLWRRSIVLKIVAMIPSLIALIIVILTAIIAIDYRLLLPNVPASNLTKAEWETDLTFLRDKLKGHPGYNPQIDSLLNHKMSRLRANLNNFTNGEKLREIINLVGTYEDGHSFVTPFQAYTKSKYFPLKGYYFDDGYYVLHASSQYDRLVNKQITHINGKEIEAVINLIHEYSGPENPWNGKHRLDFYLHNSNFLESLGVIDGETATYTYLEGTTPKTIDVKPSSFLNWLFWALKPTSFSLPPTIGLRKPNFELKQDGGTIHLIMNQVQDNSDEDTIAGLAQTLDELFASDGAKRFVIDLRNNSGGNNQLYDPLIEVIQSHKINTPDMLFVFTSRATFSAAVNFLDDLNHKTDATIIGEPAGAGPSHFGDAEMISLPSSGIFLFLSTRYWEGEDPSDTSKVIVPDVTVFYSFSDYGNRIDPWMDSLQKR